MSVLDIIEGLVGGIAVLCALASAYYFGRADGLREAERRRFWIDRGERP